MQKEPELLSGNDVIWTFVKFSGEDHSNFQTLVAFLKMLSTLVCVVNIISILWLNTHKLLIFEVDSISFIVVLGVVSFYQAHNQEGAFKVFELLQGKTLRSIGWSTLFDCLSIYEEKFKQSLQSPGALLPEFQEGDARALVAYLNVLKQVKILKDMVYSH